jgi:beta-glucanase (GH16 family)
MPTFAANHAPPRRRRRLVAATAAAAAGALAGTALLAAPSGASVPPPPSGWTQIFAEDFTGSAGSLPSSSNWIFDQGHGYPGGPTNWGTGEIEANTSNPANVSLDGGGNLRITPLRDGAGNWTSARIETQRTDFAAPNGGVLRIEGRLQLPNVSGAEAQGYWPAFWSLGTPFRSGGVWPSVGELDIMENVNGANQVWGTLHCGVSPGGPCNETSGLGGIRAGASPSLQTAFHTYAIELDKSVSPQQLRWYIDGANYFTVNQNQVDATTWTNAVNHGFFAILNVAIGGGFPGGPSGSTVSGRPMLVDYVAVYTRGGGGTTTPPPTSPPPTSPPPSGGGAYGTIQAEGFSDQAGTQLEATTDSGGGQDMGWIANGDWALYRGLDFGGQPARQFVARVASGAPAGVSGLVEVRLDSRSNAPIGSFALANSGGWQSWRTIPANIAAVTGVHDVYLTFSSGQPADFMNINWFTFGH